MESTPSELFLAAYTRHAREVLKGVYNDPVDVDAQWDRAAKSIQKELDSIRVPADAINIEKAEQWFWEEDLPLEMMRLFQNGSAQSRSGAPTFNEVWRGLSVERKEKWSTTHWLGVWASFSGVQPAQRVGASSRPGGIVFPITHKMPWDWMSQWWLKKPVDEQAVDITRHAGFKELFVNPPLSWMRIDPLSARSDHEEIKKRCQIWGAWWACGAKQLKPMTTNGVIYGDVYSRAVRSRVMLLTQPWYVNWLNDEHANESEWWAESARAVRNNVKTLPEGCRLERGLDALRQVANESRKRALGRALADEAKGRTRGEDVALERWALGLSETAFAPQKTVAL